MLVCACVGFILALQMEPPLADFGQTDKIANIIGIAIFLSRTGRLGAAHLISATNLTGLVTFAAALTGGPTSFLIPWMIIVPLEAALSSDRRVVLSAICIAGSLYVVGEAKEAFEKDWRNRVKSP